MSKGWIIQTMCDHSEIKPEIIIKKITENGTAWKLNTITFIYIYKQVLLQIIFITICCEK